MAKKRVYVACGECVPERIFSTSEAAWEFVYGHSGYDCVVESWR